MPFASVLEQNKLDGTNFNDWYRNLRIILKNQKKDYVLDAPLPDPPAADAPRATVREYEKHKDDSNEVSCLMLVSMTADLQRRLEDWTAYEMIQELKGMYEEVARVTKSKLASELFHLRMAEGASVRPHVQKMIGLIEQLGKLGYNLPLDAQTDLILFSLPPSYSMFMMNYNMAGELKPLSELHAMLATAETSIKRAPEVYAVNKASKKVGKKAKGKGKPKKGKGKAQAGSKSGPKPVRTSTPTSDTVCFHCNGKGHFKRECPKFLEEQKSARVASSKGINVVEINFVVSSSNSWIVDSGAGAHICSNVQMLTRSRKLAKGEMQLKFGNGALGAAVAVGDLELILPSGLIIEFFNVYVVPCTSKNIVSVSCLDSHGFEFAFKNRCCTISRNGLFYASASLVNGLYVLDQGTPINNISTKRLKVGDKNSCYLWHCRLGHINEKRIKKLQEGGLLGLSDWESLDRCESCLLGKMTKAPFNKSNERATELLALVHTDVCGPFGTSARGGYSYFITFTDDFSRYGYVFLMRHKSESFEKFKEFQNEVENQLGKRIKALRSDRGGEYLSHEFKDHLKQCGIVPQLTPPGTPQWNGVSERRNRTLLDMVRSMMSRTELPLSFWGFALETAAFTLNRVPTKSVDKTPYEIWTGRVPNLSFLKIWGCEVYVKRLISDKLDPKSDKCFFVGYPRETKGYYFYHKSGNKVFVARHGTFLEEEFLSKESSGSTVALEEIRDPLPEASGEAEPVQVPSEAEEQVQQVPNVRRSVRVVRQPERYLGFHEILHIDDIEPLTYNDAISRDDSEEWLGAMKSELQSMEDNQVWDLVDLPDGVKPVKNKWVFKRKTDMDGNLTVYKARLVAKGFTQVEGIDYDETFSPVAKFQSIRILLAIAAYHDYEIWQMDVKTAFLNGVLDEDVYMVQPDGFVDPKQAGKVCKLKKSIYGLKQASRSWNIRFDDEIKKLGFMRNPKEPCVYKKLSGSIVVFLVLYVDDILLIGNDIPMLESIKSSLSRVFSMKDLGEATYILGIRIYRDRSKRLIGLSQSTYIGKVLERFNMQDSKKGFLPMSHGISLSVSQCPATREQRDKMIGIPYASAIGSIMYAMLCTRPDVSYALSMTSRFQKDPGVDHWTAVKNILKYLRRTKDLILVYGGEEHLAVTGYCDASFQTDRDDSRSQTGYVYMLNGGAVCWKSSKQDSTADSTVEAEYMAACEAGKMGVWIREFIDELGVVPSIVEPVELYCDNTGAIANAKDHRSSKRTMHIKRKYHLIRELVENGDIKMCKVGTDSNTADPLTKPLPLTKHERHVGSMGIRFMRDWLS